MKAMTSRLHTGPLFWLSVPFATALTWLVHEFAHYQAGRWLGYEMWMSMNQAGPVQGEYGSTGDSMIIAMAGPVVTYAQAVIAWMLIRSKRAALAYPYLFLAWWTRTLAFVISFWSPNDEARTSLDLGLPVWLLPGIVSFLLLTLLVSGHRRLQAGWRVNFGLYLCLSAITAAIVLGDAPVGRLLQDG